jgi:hypothetical protein
MGRVRLCEIALGALIAVSASAIASVAALAALKTLDFEQYEIVGYSGPPTSFYYANMISDGARLSPACHIHVMPGSILGGYNNSTWISWDASGCGSTVGNPDYLGDPNAAADFLYLDFFGQPFTLKSFFSADFRFNVYSSKGGQQTTDFLSLIEFDGPEWTNIDWLAFDCQCGAPSPGIDHLTVEIVEPGILSLLMAGLLSIYWQRRPIKAA